MAAEEPAFLVVGHVRKPHGTRGELLVESLTDHPGDVFVSGVVLRPGDERGGAPDPDQLPLVIESVRPFQKGWLVVFDRIADRDQADALRGRYLLMERALLPGLAEGEVYRHELMGLEVFTVDGARVGRVVEVYALSPADLLEVRTARGKVLVPFVGHMIREVDVAGGRIVIDPPEGLLDS